jgi:enoyl-CoA hydratase
MSEPALLYEKKDGIAFVTMNRPDVRNAINTEMLVRLADAWQDVNDDPAVHVAILRGAGDKAFCAGADLDRLVRMMQGLRPPETDFDQRVLNDYSIIYKGLLRNYDVYKPIIAQVHGFAVAGGTEILSCTDIRIASDDALFGLAEVKWSLFPMGGSSEQIPARRALEMGLISKVVSRGELEAEALRYARIINEAGPLAVQAVKRSVLDARNLSHEKALEREMELGVPVSMSEDCREGTKAFKEKRKPVFKGR